MFKRITALMLCLILAAGLLPAANAYGREPIREQVDQCCNTLRVDPLDPNYVRPAYDGKLIELTPQRVEDHFRYLDEIYTERHPEAALLVNTGDHRDQEVLKTLAETITKGCKTDKEKADAIDRWLYRNIYYDANTSAYAYDAFYNRTGNCLSYANLMQFLLRSLGIPAVVGDGWRGVMESCTVDLFNSEGHAWCFVYLDGQWVLYDPLWIDCGTTDRKYIAKYIYLDTVEFVTPAYDGDNLPPEAWNKPKIYYTDGKWYNFDETHPNGYGNFTLLVNNQGYNFTPCQDEAALGLDGGYDGWYILDGAGDKSGMQLGEIYRNSWLSYGEYEGGGYLNLTYAHANGMQIDGAVMEYEGVMRYMQCNTSFPILADEKDYTMQYGCMAFRPGYTGPFVDVSWGDAYDSDYYIVAWESDTPEVCTVDQNGTLTAVSPGFAMVKLTLTDQEGGGYYCITYINVCVSDEARVPDYSDRAPCAHTYVYSHTIAATCTDWGYEVHICSLCGARTELYTQEPTPNDPNAHVWDGTECTRCGATRLTPFDDVVPGKFYEVPVAWAVANSITAGVSATSFAPDRDCTRGQVVTFLWRAAGCPAPKNTTHSFTDVDEKAFYYTAMLWAVENGITQGTTKTTFGPNKPCDRGTVVTFLHRAKKTPAPTSSNCPFTDVDSSRYYYTAVLWAVENGITAGISATSFAPTRICTRGQVVTFLYRAYAE